MNDSISLFIIVARKRTLSDESDVEENCGPCTKEFKMAKKLERKKVDMQTHGIDLDATGLPKILLFNSFKLQNVFQIYSCVC